MSLARRAVLAAAALAALAAAVVLALVAEDARRWPERVHKGDVSALESAALSRRIGRDREQRFGFLRRGGTRRQRERERERRPLSILPKPNPWGTGFFSTYAERTLGLEEQLQLRRALQAVLRTRPGTERHEGLQLRQGEAESLLTEVIKRDTDARRRSMAANWLGILLFENVMLSASNPELLGRSLAAFEAAVLLDPRNDDAKFNVEQLLTLRPDSEEEKEREKDKGRARGQAGEDRPGTGY